MHGVLSFPLTAEQAAGEGLTSLTEGLALGRRRRGAAQLTFYDTFDGRLWQEQLCLRGFVSGGRRELQLLTFAGEIEGRSPLAEAIDFAARLPPGRLRETVLELAGERRLLAALTVEKQIVARPLYTARGSAAGGTPAGGTPARGPAPRRLAGRLLARKVIGYLSLVERRVLPAEDGDPRELRRRLRIEPLRGYDKACKPIAEALEARLGRPPESLAEELAEALTAAGSWLEDRSKKPDFHLDPDEPAGTAVLRILRPLRETLRANDQGVVAELDREFLHDYRVAVRRLRSAVGQLKRLFPARELEALRAELGWLGEQTGPKRDLDVLLEMLPKALEPLPAWVRRGFEPARAHLEAAAAEAQAELAKSFSSSRYQQVMGALDGFLERRARAARQPAEARRPIREVASERLDRAARRVAERADELGPDPEPAALHRLRIACKKLRYLLEFFRSLYEKAEIDRVVEALKDLQDVLGALNDLANQDQALRRAAEAVAPGQAPQALAATGYLVARLDERRAHEAEKLAGALRAFLKHDNQERIRGLF